MRYLYCLFIGLAIFGASVQAQEAIFAGQAVTLYETDDEAIQAGTLFYRIEGGRQFFALPMQHKGDLWIAGLAAQQVQAPGVEYYVSLRLSDGSVRTEPANYPEYNPSRLRVQSQDTVSLERLDSGAEGEDIRLLIQGFVAEDARLLIDDIDVTDLIQRDGEEWTITESGSLFEGAQAIALVDGQGRVMVDAIVDLAEGKTPQAAKDGELVLRGNAGINIGGRQVKTDDDQGSWALTGNLNLNTEYLNGDFRSELPSANINYDQDGEPRVTLSAGYRLRNTYKNHTVDIGDVSISGMPLVISSFSRRGLVASTQGQTWKGSMFNVRTAMVDGNNSGISFDERQTYGVTVEKNFVEMGSSSLQFTAVSGELPQPVTASVESRQTSPQAGDAVGIQLSSQWGGVGMSVQVAQTSFDNDTLDDVAAVSDSAYELSLSKDFSNLAAQFSYFHYGVNYATITNPNFSGDRQGVNASLGGQWRELGWSLNAARMEDNVDQDITRSVVNSDTAGLMFDFPIMAKASANLGYSVNQQHSSDEPTVDDRVDNQGQEIQLGLNGNVGAAALSWQSQFGELSNKLDRDNDSETENHSFGLTYQLRNIGVNLNLSQQTSNTQIEQVASLVNLGLNLPLFSDDVILNSQFSGQENTASDNSQDNTIFGGSLRVSWTLQDIVMIKSLDWVNPRFSVSWTQHRTVDHLDTSLNESSHTVMLDFSFGAPYSFENRWQL